MTVIPDSIEPVEGWKAFLVIPSDKNIAAHQALLVSPSRGTIWMPGEAMQAEGCTITNEPEWVATRHNRPPPSPELHSVHVASPKYAMGATGTAGAFAVPVPPWAPNHYIPSPPQTLLPPGYSWSLVRRAVQHDPPQDGCGCGVHITKSFSNAFGYGSSPLVMARVKGWGRVAVHDDGWRVEKAYPSEIYTDANVDLSAYGVPVMPLADLGERERRFAKDYGPYVGVIPPTPAPPRVRNTFSVARRTLIGAEATLGFAATIWAVSGNVYAVPAAVVGLAAAIVMLSLP